MNKIGRLTDTVAVTDPKTGKATAVFARYWDIACTALEKGPSQLDAAYVAGAPAATGYALITIQGVQYKVLVST